LDVLAQENLPTLPEGVTFTGRKEQNLGLTANAVLEASVLALCHNQCR